MIRIGVFTDEPLAVIGLSAVLEAESDCQIAGFWDDAAGLTRMVEQTQPGILVLDMASGLTLWRIAELRQRAPECKLICWARKIQFDLAMNLLEIGIRGMLPKTIPGHLLCGLIRRVAAGEHYVDGTLFAPAPAQALRLTGRERQILTMVSLGMRNREIASALAISEGTMKVYVSRLLQKTGVRDRRQLTFCRLQDPESSTIIPVLSSGPAQSSIRQ